MNIARRPSDIGFDRNSVVTVGSFDGVHLAHQSVLRAVVQRARDRNGRSVAVTFEPHPKQVLVHDGAPITLLTTLEERIALCADQGLDLLYVLEFTYEFSRQRFRDFYKKYVVEGVGVSEVVEGYDHHFGRDREGSVRELLAMGNEFGFTVTAMKPVTVDMLNAPLPSHPVPHVSTVCLRKGGGVIAFDHGARTYRFGVGFDETEAKQIVTAIKKHCRIRESAMR